MNKRIFTFATIAISASCSIAFSQSSASLLKKQKSANSKPITQSVGAVKKGNAQGMPSLFSGSQATSSIPRIVLSPKSGTPILIEIPITTSLPQRSVLNSVSSENICYNFLLKFKDNMKLSSPLKELELESKETDKLGFTHYKYNQIFKGVKVWGAQAILHEKNSEINSLTGATYPTPKIASTSPGISAQTASKTAVADVAKYTSVETLSENQQKILDYQKPISELVIYHTNGTPGSEKLTWHITVRPSFIYRYEYFIDAQTGKILHHFNNTQTAPEAKTAIAKDLNDVDRTIHTTADSGKFFLADISKPMFDSAREDGLIVVLDAQNTTGDGNCPPVSSADNVEWKPEAVSAQFNADSAYTYFYKIHGRNSINGKGCAIYSIINVTSKDGSGLDNAYWNGKAIFYGNGNTAFKPLAGALDVAGHEFTHGVIENSANLIYENQSGALNESFADIFASMIDKSNWMIGEDITKTSYIETGALRKMDDPHNDGKDGWQPKTMAEFKVLPNTEDGDNGGVHANSGIPNYAFYLIATAISKEKAENVLYRALTVYLTKSSQFVDLRIATIKSATDLYGTGTEIEEIKKAFDSVGIVESTQQTYTYDLQPNTGTNYVIYRTTDAGKEGKIYAIEVGKTDTISLTTTTPISRQSLPDNGQFMVFVGDDFKLHKVDLTATPFTETIIENQDVWSNAAISKDGKKVALTSRYSDTSIYVLDLLAKDANNTLTRFMLYNPTHTVGDIKTGGVVYADALSWDNTGQYVAYDAYNKISSGNDSIDFWDVGFMNVWDNKTNSAGSGDIFKLFTNLPEMVSIGNPVFSKNSPYIVAYDYVNSKDKSFLIEATNLETMKSDTIVINDTIGLPDFSNNDDKIIFTNYNQGNEQIMQISLEASKIRGGATVSTIVNKAKYATWANNGERQLMKTDKLITEFRLTDPAIKCSIVDTNITATVAETTDISKLIPIFTNSPFSEVFIENTPQTSGVNSINFTEPVIYTVYAEDGSFKKYKVVINKEVTLSSANELLTYALGENTGTINGTTVTIDVPDTIDVTKQIATFTISPKAKAKINEISQESGVTENDFTSAVTYTIIAENGSTQNYTVTVSKKTSNNLFSNDVCTILYNSTSKVLNINNASTSDYTFVISNPLGEVIYSEKNTKQLNLSTIYRGAYLLTIFTPTTIVSKTIIIE